MFYLKVKAKINTHIQFEYVVTTMEYCCGLRCFALCLDGTLGWTIFSNHKIRIHESFLWLRLGLTENIGLLSIDLFSPVFIPGFTS